MIIIATNKLLNQKIAFTNNTDARIRLEKRTDINAVLILGKYDLGFPDVNTKTTELNRVDGLVIDNIKYTKRILQFNTNFTGKTELAISKQRQLLARIINSQQKLIELEFYRNNQEDSEQEKFYLRNVVGKISYQSSDGQRLTSSQQSLLVFEAHKPLFEKPVKKQTFHNSIAGNGKSYPFAYPFSYDSITGDVGEINNGGDVPIPFIAEFHGTLNAAELKSNTVEKTIKFKTGTQIPDTEKLIVNTDTRTATIDGVNAYDKLDPVTRYYNLETGKNELVFTAGNNNADNSVTLSWIERFISI